jgi:hypothetical protein
MTYDLRRLRLHGLIQRVPGSHRYMVTLDGWQVAGFYNTLYHHVLRPGWTTLAEPSTSTRDPVAVAVRHLADVTRGLFQQIHPDPDHSAAAA